MRLRLFSCVVAALSVQQAVSIPFDNRAASNSDTSTVQFALTLEHVEVAFYTLGLQLFNESTFISAGYTPIVHRRFVEIFEHEQDHVALLSSLLGEQAPQACNYSFPLTPTDIQSFIDLSQVLEEVGTCAYTGAIQLLSSTENILVSASILATEANQAAWVASSANNDVPWGGSFKTALTMRQAFTLASPFIVSCPSSNPNLNLTPFPSLNIDGAFPTNQTAFPGLTANVQIAPNLTATHIAFFTGLKPIFVPIENGTVLLPQNVSGQVYAIATSSESDSSDDSTVAGPAIMLFERFTNESLTN